MQRNSNPTRKEPNLTTSPDPADRTAEATIRGERRDERAHVRVQLPFVVTFDGEQCDGHDISTGGFSTTQRPDMKVDDSADCTIDVECSGFYASIPATARFLGTRSNDKGARFEFMGLGQQELTTLQRLIRAHLAGVHLTVDQLSATDDPQTVRTRDKKPTAAQQTPPKLARLASVAAVLVVLYLVLGAALYDHFFVIEPNFAAVTAPEIQIHAPTNGVLAPHKFNPGDVVKRDQALAAVEDPEIDAQLTLADATLKYNEHLLANMKESLRNDRGGSASVISAGSASDGAPVVTKLTPLELRARVKEIETTYTFAKAKLEALKARASSGAIYATCDCTIYSIRSGVGGYWLQKGELIARLITNGPKDIMVEALVHLNEISSIEPGERAQVVMPTTGEVLPARVASIQLEGQKSERAGFPEWARQDMSHGTVVLTMEKPLPASLVGHPVRVRFIDTESAVGEVISDVLGTTRQLLDSVAAKVSSLLHGSTSG